MYCFMHVGFLNKTEEGEGRQYSTPQVPGGECPGRGSGHQGTPLLGRS